MQIIERELQHARANLLDLTLRNRLLNYRVSKARSVRVVGEAPAEVYDALVLRQAALEFRSARGPSKDVPDSGIDEQTAASVAAAIWEARKDNDLRSHHVDRYLQTPYEKDALSKRLFKIYHEGRSVVEEQGYTVVHLALAFLEWSEDEKSTDSRRAPLLLVPAELERIAAGDFARVRWTGEDVVANVSLAAKLSEFGISMPPFEAPENKAGIDAWLGETARAIQHNNRWRIVSDMVLDFFSFTKFVMYKDLDPAAWPAEKKPHEHELLATLFAPTTDVVSDPGFDENDVDLRVSARDLIHVMDADPSQIAVTQDVRSGRNLVVQGPPGTGKSQTITNIIGEALAENKTVLFISEKMAALQVVKLRLDAAGLGPFCLELHSRKSNRKTVLDELENALRSTPLPEGSTEVLARHDQLKAELNAFAGELGAPVGNLSYTPYDLYGMRDGALSHLAARGEVTELPVVVGAEALTPSDVERASAALVELDSRFINVHPTGSHSWRRSARDVMYPHQERELVDLLAECQEALSQFRDAAQKLSEIAGTVEPLRLADAAKAAAAAEVLARVPGPVEPAVLLNTQWNERPPDVDVLIQRASGLQQKREDLSRTFRTEALDWECQDRLDEFKPLARQWLRLFSSRYRALRRQLVALYAAPVPNTRQIVIDLERLAAMHRERAALRSDGRGFTLFGGRWLAEQSDVEGLRKLAQWLVEFRGELLRATLRQCVAATTGLHEKANDTALCAAQLRDAARALKSTVVELLSWVCVDPEMEFGAALDDVAAAQLSETLVRWAGATADLYRWAQFNAALAVTNGTAAAPIAKMVRGGSLEPGTLDAAFRGALSESLLRYAFEQRGELGTFAGDRQDRRIARFAESDASLVKVNRVRLSRLLHERRPRLAGGASRNSEAGILVGEFSRKRRHMPIRKLLSVAGELVQRIKPCFLMSPLSVAQFLDPRTARFDIIVIDEASQIKPEDALGTLLRGRQLVVMGDTKQLPPTSFFDHLVDTDYSDEEADVPQAAGIDDVESILHQCARSYPTKSLNWHYRSRHESLIAISNYHFYDNGLRIYPSAIDESEELGLHFRHVPDGVYERGKSATNVVEAKAVAAAAVDHFLRFPDRSLGIGAFSVRQQHAILEEIELQLTRHPELESRFKSGGSEAFFVKNLETIQGDERDVILISVAYGRDALGRMGLNFGPINREGGERRLNVLISRARQKCVVFSNFTFRDIPADQITSKGLFALRAFLEYAETRHINIAEALDVDGTSAFVDAMESALVSAGHRVAKNVGCSGFRVDLAVVDPTDLGRYLVAIECDGPKYHNAPVARDRDRLRDQMLRSLGWHVVRAWSTDWYRNPDEAKKTLLAAVDGVRNAPRTELPLDQSSRAPTALSDDAEVHNDPAEAGSQISPPATSAAPVKYEVCRAIRVPIVTELYLTPTHELARAVEDIVQVESPIHVEEVIRRLRGFWGVAKAGTRIRKAVNEAIKAATRAKKIRVDDAFLYFLGAPVAARRREDDPPPRIDLICDDEIREAVRAVLASQFATSRRELVTAVARWLGIQSTSEATAGRISHVIDAESGLESRWIVDSLNVVRLRDR